MKRGRFQPRREHTTLPVWFWIRGGLCVYTQRPGDGTRLAGITCARPTYRSLRLKTKSPRPPNRDRGEHRIHFRRWHSTL